MLTPPLHFFSFNKRKASALIGTLVMVGILAMSVGVMLSSSSRVIRGSRDKILYEEAYQAALSGTHVARAWMLDPALAKAMTGSDALETEIKALVYKGLQMNDEILFDRERGNTLNLQGTTIRYTAKPAYFSLGKTLENGRVVLYDFPADSPIVSFINDSDDKTFSDNLFQGTPEKGHRNYVERIRITTPPMDTESSVSLLECTFVIESHGVAEYAGTRKERVLHQRVLLFPKQPGGALMSAGESIITEGSMTIAGKSHANVHWAPVKAKGDIALEFLETLNPVLNGSTIDKWNFKTVDGTGKKFNGAGVLMEDPNFKYTGVLDKWLKWMSGSKGQLLGVETVLLNNKTMPLFHKLKDSLGNPLPVKDFFAEVVNNEYNNATSNLRKDNLNLLGQYVVAGTTMQDSTGVKGTYSNGMYKIDGAGVAKDGALVQGSAEVDASVDSFFGTMNYKELKEYAKNHDGYYYYDGSSLYDSTGKLVPTKQYPDMIGQVGTGVLDPLSETVAPDRVLFIDSAADKDSLEPNNPFTGDFKLPNFWKGVMYVNGNITQSSAGGSGPSMVVRTPDQFQDYRDDIENSGSYKIDNVLIDGIMICNGLAGLAGNTTIYGTLAALDGVSVGGTPSIFYNSANGEGRMKGDQSMSAKFRLIAGKLYGK